MEMKTHYVHVSSFCCGLIMKPILYSFDVISDHEIRSRWILSLCVIKW